MKRDPGSRGGRSAPRRVQGILLGIALSWLLQGCSVRDGSYATGTYRGVLVRPDGTTEVVSSGFHRSDGVTHDEHSRLCEISGVTWGSNAQIRSEELAAFDGTLSRPLCVKGPRPITGGFVRFWIPVAPGSRTVQATAVPGWRVSGELIVTEVIDHHPGEPDVDETVLSETVKGTFELIAAHADGDTLALRDGTFEMDIEHYRYRWEP